jgi:hypothetical protein
MDRNMDPRRHWGMNPGTSMPVPAVGVRWSDRRDRTGDVARAAAVGIEPQDEDG